LGALGSQLSPLDARDGHEAATVHNGLRALLGKDLIAFRPRQPALVPVMARMICGPSLPELRAANLEIALKEMQSQRDMWREQAQRLATAAQR
jgi:hypothetical protein